jgi:hypothetical protein
VFPFRAALSKPSTVPRGVPRPIVSVGDAGGASAEVDLAGAAWDHRVGQDSKSRQSTTALPRCGSLVLRKQLGIKSAMLVSVLESSMEPYLDCGNRKLSVKRSLLAPTFSSLISSDGSSLTPYSALGSKARPRNLRTPQRLR